MDPRLAEIYGTAQVDDSDLEKAAAAELAEGLAEEDGSIDLDSLNEEQLEYLASQVLAEEGAEEEAPSEDDSQEKLAEADYLGRVMAHAYVNEIRGIEKQAEEAAATEAPPTRMQRAKAFGKKHWKKGAVAGGTIAAGVGIAKGGRPLRLAQLKRSAKKGVEKAVAEKAKTSSALETLAEARALEILEENGIDPSELEKQATQIGPDMPRAEKLKGMLTDAYGAVKNNPGTTAKAVGGTALAVGGALGGRHMWKKHKAKQQAAAEATKTSSAEFEEDMDPAEALAETVEAGAWDILSQYGLEPSDE